MKLNDFLVMIGLKLLVIGYLENTLRYTTPFKNSEKSVKTQSESEFRKNIFIFFLLRKTKVNSELLYVFHTLSPLNSFVILIHGTNCRCLKSSVIYERFPLLGDCFGN